jgi:16S rRNA (guanine527-N7)-methyltransferase
MNKKEFLIALEKLDIKYSEEQLNKLEEYYTILVEENKKYNLTAITEKEEVYLKHFYDSLTIVKAISLDDKVNLCDIGSGAGFPGIVLKIFFKELNITLLDSSKKRTDFLTLVTKKLGLEKIKIVTSRAEEFLEKEEYDIVTARAVAPLRILLELSSQMIKINGCFVALKGKNGEKELEESLNCIKKLGFVHENTTKIDLPKDAGERNIIKITKKQKTNKEYPRIYSKIKKNPL